MARRSNLEILRLTAPSARNRQEWRDLSAKERYRLLNVRKELLKKQRKRRMAEAEFKLKTRRPAVLLAPVGELSLWLCAFLVGWELSALAQG